MLGNVYNTRTERGLLFWGGSTSVHVQGGWFKTSRDHFMVGGEVTGDCPLGTAMCLTFQGALLYDCPFALTSLHTSVHVYLTCFCMCVFYPCGKNNNSEIIAQRGLIQSYVLLFLQNQHCRTDGQTQ